MHGNRKRVFPMICIILAGGKGTRLQSVVTDVPKPLALVQGSPFLDILINNLKNRGIEGFIISVGYKKEIILEHYKNNKSLPIKFSEEEIPLLTGGALKKASVGLEEEDVVVVNGDTYSDFDLSKMLQFHRESNADVTIASTWLANTGRYGRLELEGTNVLKFLEKNKDSEGYINAGTYLLKGSILTNEKREIFSFEEWLMRNLKELNVKAFTQCENFIDIGIPEDYMRAQNFNFGGI